MVAQMLFTKSLLWMWSLIPKESIVNEGSPYGFVWSEGFPRWNCLIWKANSQTDISVATIVCSRESSCSLASWEAACQRAEGSCAAAVEIPDADAPESYPTAFLSLKCEGLWDGLLCSLGWPGTHSLALSFPVWDLIDTTISHYEISFSCSLDSF